MSEEKPFVIYVTMAVEWAEPHHPKQPLVRKRTWGFFRDRETAIKAVMENWGDNFDEAGYYNGAIIEEVAEGYWYSDPEACWFYRRVPGAEWKMEEIPRPPYYKQVCAITMG